MFFDRNSGELSNNILSEVDTLISEVIYPAFSMIAYSFVVITITLFLLRVDPLLALLAAGLLGGLYTAVYFRLKQKLVSLGSTLVVSNKNRYTAANEVFGGIKNIKLLGREQIYLSHFQNPSRELSDAAASQRTLSQVPKYIIEAFAFGGIILIVLILMSRSGGLSSTLLGQILPIVGIYTFSAYRLQLLYKMYIKE